MTIGSIEREFLTVRELVARYSFLRLGGVRDWIFHDRSGFRTRCVRKLGRKVVISVPEFIAWVDGQSTTPRTSAWGEPTGGARERGGR